MILLIFCETRACSLTPPIYWYCRHGFNLWSHPTNSADRLTQTHAVTHDICGLCVPISCVSGFGGRNSSNRTVYKPYVAKPGSGIHCHPPGFSESGIQLASATGGPLGFLWIYVQGYIKWANKNLDSGLFSFAARISHVGTRAGGHPPVYSQIRPHRSIHRRLRSQTVPHSHHLSVHGVSDEQVGIHLLHSQTYPHRSFGL